MKIALTGGTGFLGRHILRSLVKRNLAVRVIVRNMGGLDPAVLDYPNVDLVEVRDIFYEPHNNLKDLLASCDTLIHAAWYTNSSDYQSSQENIRCLKGSIALATAFADAGGSRMIGIGTCSEYMTSNELTTVNTPLQPSTLYAACKASTFYTLTELSKLLNISFSWCRLFYLFGEGQQSNKLIPTLHYRLPRGMEVELTLGHQVRDWLEVQTAADIIVTRALSGKEGPFNVCSGIGVSVRDISLAVAESYGRGDLLLFGARPENPFDPEFIVAEKIEP